jgi:sulfur carrier protein
MERIQTRDAAAHKPPAKSSAQPGGHRWALAAGAARGDNGAMDVLLNGEPRQLVAPTTVAQLLQREGLAERRVAVEVNGEIVPRSRHGERPLAPGDRIEIVHALGGG